MLMGRAALLASLIAGGVAAGALTSRRRSLSGRTRSGRRPWSVASRSQAGRAQPTSSTATPQPRIAVRLAMAWGGW